MNNISKENELLALIMLCSSMMSFSMIDLPIDVLKALYGIAIYIIVVYLFGDLTTDNGEDKE